MEWQLLSQDKAAELIALIGQDGQPFELRLGEDICFGTNPDEWVQAGTISLFPSRLKSAADEEALAETYYDEVFAAKFGGFEWRLPTQEGLLNNLEHALDGLEQKHKDSIQKFFSQGLQDVLRRSLLLLPVFDADTVGYLPLRKPMTVVTDTSAVHQGGLDFVGRFLVPWARIKVPATVHMELVQNSDNYFQGIRRNKKAWVTENEQLKPNHKPQALYQHLLSQGGQRTLIRLEYSTETEIDRGDLGTDPLRSILRPVKDHQDSELGMLDVVKSFGDRLIVETAHQVRLRGRSDHPVVILTSDQGMARMAIAEGLEVFFFQARSAPQFFGKRVTGTLFHPFKPELYTVSLTSVLWELAVSFGCLQLHNPNNGASLELWGIGGPEWQPLHAKDDLLWGKFFGARAGLTSVNPSEEQTIVSDSSEQQNEPEITKVQSASDPEPSSEVPREAEVLTGAYKFSPNKMFEFIKHLNEREYLTDAEGQEVTNFSNREWYRRYRNFLRSGQFVYLNGEDTVALPALKEFWQALVDEDPEAVLECLLRVPSFKVLYEYIRQRRQVEEGSKEFPTPAIALPNYLALGEAACAWLTINKQGVVITDRNERQLAEFAEIAVEIYQRLSTQAKTEWVLTGQWLEELAAQAAIHPIAAQALTAEARSQDLLRVYAEGSTPDTRFDRHSMWVLKNVDGNPKLIKVYLYHGDFLLPGTSSVRVKLQEVRHAP